MDFRFEVALSFAGDGKRDIIRRTAETLREFLGEGRVFFDEWFEEEIAGVDAQIVLQNIYSDQSFLIVACVCGRYNEKPWTQDEWRAILSLERKLRDAATTNSDRLRFLPVRFGDGKIDGLFDTAIVKDMRAKTPEEIAAFILKRLALARDRQCSSLPESCAVELPSVIDAEAEMMLGEIHRENPERIIPSLDERLKLCEDPTERYWIYELLNRFDSEDARSILKQCVNDPDPFARSAIHISNGEIESD